MGYAHVTAEVREKRRALLAPVSDTLKQRGVMRQWFADQMGVSFSSLWNYFNGYDRIPPTFLERACQVLGIPASLIPIPEPRGLYIQQPRSVKSTTTTAKGQHGDDPQRSQSDDRRRVRRT